jgi:hypothetical protein
MLYQYQGQDRLRFEIVSCEVILRSFGLAFCFVLGLCLVPPPLSTSIIASSHHLKRSVGLQTLSQNLLHKNTQFCVRLVGTKYRVAVTPSEPHKNARIDEDLIFHVKKVDCLPVHHTTENPHTITNTTVLFLVDDDDDISSSFNASTQ